MWNLISFSLCRGGKNDRFPSFGVFRRHVWYFILSTHVKTKFSISWYRYIVLYIYIFATIPIIPLCLFTLHPVERWRPNRLPSGILYQMLHSLTWYLTYVTYPWWRDMKLHYGGNHHRNPPTKREGPPLPGSPWARHLPPGAQQGIRSGADGRGNNRRLRGATPRDGKLPALRGGKGEMRRFGDGTPSELDVTAAGLYCLDRRDFFSTSISISIIRTFY